MEKLKGSGDVPGLVRALGTRYNPTKDARHQKRRGNVRYDAAVALGEVRAESAIPDPIKAVLKDEHPVCFREMGLAIERAATRALDQIGPAAADQLYADSEAVLVVGGALLSSLESGEVRRAAMAMGELRNLSAEMEQHRLVSGLVVIESVEERVEALLKEARLHNPFRTSGLESTRDALRSALDAIAPKAKRSASQAPTSTPLEWSAELSADPVTEQPAAPADVACCRVCGTDLSAAPAVRNNDTGALYCYEHREHVLD